MSLKDILLKVGQFVKENWKWLLLIPIIYIMFGTDKVKTWWNGLFGKDKEGATNISGSDYLGGHTSDIDKGVIVGSDGNEYFRYGSKKVRLTDGNKAKVVEYVNLLYQYMSNNTTSVMEWLTDDELHFYTGEIQMVLNDYKRWCNNQETWYHYLAYVWMVLHTIPFLDYLKATMDAEGYDATRTYVTNLNLFYY